MGLADGLLNFAGSAIASGMNVMNSREQRDWEAEQRDKQNQWNLDQWNRENEYNSPLEQQKRLQAAGINPIDASNLVDAGSASSKESSNVNPVSPAHIDNPMAGGLQITQEQLAKAEIALKKSQEDLNKDLGAKTRSETETIEKSRELILEKLGLDCKVAQSVADLNVEQKAEISQRITESQKRIEEIDNQIFVNVERLNLDKRKFAFDKFIQQARLNLEKERLSIEDKQALASMLNARAAKLMADTSAQAEGRAQEKHKFEMLIVEADGKIKAQKVTQEEYATKVAEAEVKFADYNAYASCLQKFADIEKKSWLAGPFGIPIRVNSRESFNRNRDTDVSQQGYNAAKGLSTMQPSFVNK